MHTEGIIKIGISDVIDNLKPNQTHYRSVTLAGKIGIDSACKGTQYSDFYGRCSCTGTSYYHITNRLYTCESENRTCNS